MEYLKEHHRVIIQTLIILFTFSLIYWSVFMTVVMVTIVIYDIMKHYESVKGIDKVNKYISEGHYKYDLISWLGLMLFGIVHGGLVFSITATILLSLVVLLKIRFTKDKENSNASKKE